MKKILAIILVLCTSAFSLCSCSNANNVDAIKQSFSSYIADNHIGIKCNDIIYFDNFLLDFNQFVQSNESIEFVNTKHDGFYYVSSKETGMFSFELTIYECDFAGKNSKVLFSQSGYETSPSVLGDEEGIFIEHHVGNAWGERIVDYYNLATDEYISNLTYEEDQNLKQILSASSNIVKCYEITNTLTDDRDNYQITITRLSDKETRVISDDLLKNAEFYSLLTQYDYELKSGHLYNGSTILFSCILDTGDFWSVSPHQGCVVFEYDFDKQQILFKTLVFAPDLESYSIVHINE